MVFGLCRISSIRFTPPEVILPIATLHYSPARSQRKFTSRYFLRSHGSLTTSVAGELERLPPSSQLPTMRG